MPGDVHLADRLAEAALDGGDGPLPARAILGNAAERAAVEGEVRLDQPPVQQARVLMDYFPLQPRLPDSQRRRVRHLGDGREVRRLRNDEFLRGAGADGVEVRLPVEAGRQPDKLLAGPLVVGLDVVAVVLLRPLCPGKPRLEGHDLGGGALGIGDAANRQALRHVRPVGRQLLLVLGVPVVVAVREAEARLGEMKDVPIGSLGIGSDRAVQHAADPDPRQLGEHPHEAGLGLDPVDRRERASDGLDAKPLGLRLIHVRGVQVSDLLFRVRCVLAGAGTALDDGEDVLFGLFGKDREGAVVGAVGGDLGLGKPGAVDRVE